MPTGVEISDQEPVLRHMANFTSRESFYSCPLELKLTCRGYFCLLKPNESVTWWIVLNSIETKENTCISFLPLWSLFF